MKIYSLIILFLAINVINIHSQNFEKGKSRNEFYASYGGASVPEISAYFSNIIAFPFVLLSIEPRNPVGPVIAGYNRFVSDKMSVGIMGSYITYKVDYRYTLTDKIIGTAIDKYYSLMGRTDYHFINSDYFQLYSGFSIGVTYLKSNNADSSGSASATHLAYQVNAIGVRVGKNFGAFLELGFGYNGIVNGGISLKF